MIATSFNRSPYFDDYSSSKNTLKVLFRPSRNVQARELNQIQSIFQGQIERFANHFFKNGSRVSDARISIVKSSYITINDIDANGLLVDIEKIHNDATIIGRTSGVTARVVHSERKVQQLPNIIFISYIQSSTEFVDNEILDITYGDLVYSVRARTSAIGELLVRGTDNLFHITEGVFYYNGYFISNEPARVSLTRQGISKDVKVGFDVVFQIITSKNDRTLLDNSVGTPSRYAPGADRLKVSLNLVKRSLSADDGNDFILLMKYEDGNVTLSKNSTDYNEFGDYLAKRTFEESGNYCLSKPLVKFIEAKAANIKDPMGYSVDGAENQVVGIVEPITAYVNGYRLMVETPRYIFLNKARTTESRSAKQIKIPHQSYVRLIPTTLSTIMPNNPLATSYLTSDVINIFDGSSSTLGPLVGTCKISDVYKESGAVGSGLAVYRYMIYDFNLVSGKTLSDVKVFKNDDYGFIADVRLDESSLKFEIYDSAKKDFIVRLNESHITSIRKYGNPLQHNASITVRKKTVALLDIAGAAIIQPATGETFLAFNDITTTSILQSGASTSAFDLTNMFSLVGGSIHIQAGITNANKTIILYHDVKIISPEKTKTRSNIIEQVSASSGTIILTKSDIIKVNSVTYIVNSTGARIDITNQYNIDTGCKDFAYVNGSIYPAVGTISQTITVGDNIEINYDYYSHSGGGLFFSADSYWDHSKEFPYDDYKNWSGYNTRSGDSYALSNCLDFRPLVINNVYPDNSYIFSQNSFIQYDVEYFLGRLDYICINKDGVLYSKTGKPATSPNPPAVDADEMTICVVDMGPYTYSIRDVRSNVIANKRYTMRDIGKIEERIKNIEYYTALSALEKSAADMKIKDANGLDRFKNGFVVDDFSGFQAADITNPEFKAAIDRKYKELRPSFTARSRNLYFNESSSNNFDKRSSMVTLPFTKVIKDEQPYATKSISINPYFQFAKQGKMVLSPNNDTWADTSRPPKLQIEVDTGVDALQALGEATGILDTVWGSWVDGNTTIISQSVATNERVISNPVFGQNLPAVGWSLPGLSGQVRTGIETVNQTWSDTTTVMGQIQTREGIDYNIESRTDSYDLGDRLTDIRFIPFIRKNEVEFYCTNMSKNTKVYAFFDGTKVSEHCRKINEWMYGEQLITDGEGTLKGVFRIPEGKFFVGERDLIITGDPENTGDDDLTRTFAKSSYFAGGLDLTKQETTLNVITPTWSAEEVSESKIIPGPTITQSSLVAATSSVQQLTQFRLGASASSMSGLNNGDPVAQSFKFERDHFVAAIDLFFKEVDLKNQNFWVELRTMKNGYPTFQALARKDYKTADIVISEDSAAAFHVEFDFPVFVKGEVEYCFVVGGWSPETRIWISKLGDEIVGQPGSNVETQPSLGSSFRSQNGTTWNAEQYEDIKYRLYVAKFTSNTLTAVFNQVEERQRLDFNPFEADIDTKLIRVYHKNHGMNRGDKFKIEMFEDELYSVRVTRGQLMIGMEIQVAGGGGRCIVADIVEVNQSEDLIRIKIKNLEGVITPGAGQQLAFFALSMSINASDNFLLRANSISETIPPFNDVTGVILEGPIPKINGINSERLIGQHFVYQSDCIDSFTFEIINPTYPLAAGRFGGAGVYITDNTKYDVFNISGAYMPYGAAEQWLYQGTGHNQYVGTDETRGLFVDFDYKKMEPIDIQIGSDVFLGQPHKLASYANEASRIDSGSRSVNVIASLVAPDEWVTPVINTSTFSMVNISNAVEMINPDIMNTEPNGIGRYTNETTSYKGSESYKYVTNTIKLKNAASDVSIAFDAYKDSTADFELYFKKTTAFDTVNIDNMPWVKIPYTIPRDSTSQKDRVEHELLLSESFTNPPWDNTPFNEFKFKIVGKSYNSCKPPTFRSLRIIAVT